LIETANYTNTMLCVLIKLRTKAPGNPWTKQHCSIHPPLPPNPGCTPPHPGHPHTSPRAPQHLTHAGCYSQNQTLGKIEKRVWEIGWGGSVHCARNAGALPIDSLLHAYARLLEIQTATR